MKKNYGKDDAVLREKWESLTLANNFVFYKVMRNNPDVCRHLIEILLGIKIERMRITGEETIAMDYDSHGIRLDVYAKSQERVFDIEMQVVNTRDLPERARYYQGVMDLDNLKAGQMYGEMKSSHVIFICMEDIFRNGLPVCTFENVCVEDRKTKLNDGTYKHFFIAQTCAKLLEEGEAKEFFRFLTSSRAENAYTGRLKSLVENARHNMQWRMQYMTWERQRAYDLKQGREEGARENALANARTLLSLGVDTQTVSKGCSLPLEKVLALKKEITGLELAGEHPILQ